MMTCLISHNYWTNISPKESHVSEVNAKLLHFPSALHRRGGLASLKGVFQLTCTELFQCSQTVENKLLKSMQHLINLCLNLGINVFRQSYFHFLMHTCDQTKG